MIRLLGVISVVAALVGCSFDTTQLDTKSCSEEKPCSTPGTVCSAGFCVAASSIDTRVDTGGEVIEDLCGDAVCEVGQACCNDTCIDVVQDSANCGDCNVQCGTGEICSDGACRCGPEVLAGGSACLADQVCCGDPSTDGICANIFFDSLHCGACGNVCNGGAPCIGGVCGCPAGQDRCGGEDCISILDNDTNCGACDSTCGDDTSCFSGACSCGGTQCTASPNIACCQAGGVSFCADTDTSPLNCGGCGQQCRPGEACVDGVCACGSNTCTDSEICCDDNGTPTCADAGTGCPCGGDNCTNTDVCCDDGSGNLSCANLVSADPHCGACGNPCSSDQSCTGGVCVCDPVTELDAEGEEVTIPTSNCGGVCTRLDTDDNCGVCGNACGNGQVCCNSQCVDPSTLSTALNCGGCGIVCGSGDCVNAQCDCGEGSVDLTADDDNCGACGNVCPTRPFTQGQEYCEEGRCNALPCISGRLDCDGNLANGCEVDTQTSTEYCGATSCSNGGGGSGQCADNEVCLAGQCVVPPSLRDLDVGGFHACGVKSDGTAWCWGLNSSGQLGDTSTDDAAEPIRAWDGTGGIPDIASIIGIATGGPLDGKGFTCALLNASNNNRVECWGIGGAGQMGNGDTNDAKDAPVTVTLGNGNNLLNVTQVTAGLAHACALKDDGTVWCWGEGSSGQLGNGASQDSSVAVRVQRFNDFVHIDAGSTHTCGVRQGGQAVCWGSNGKGQLGDGTRAGKNTPARAGSFGNALKIAAGEEHSCVVLDTGAMKCWGRDDKDQLGAGNPGDSNDPVDVLDLTDAVYVAASGESTCAITSTQALYCWGENDQGQLGLGNKTRQDRPAAVTTITDALLVEMSPEHTCVVRSTSVSCFGKGDGGQLGDGQSKNETAPVQVLNLP